MLYVALCRMSRRPFKNYSQVHTESKSKTENWGKEEEEEEEKNKNKESIVFFLDLFVLRITTNHHFFGT